MSAATCPHGGGPASACSQCLGVRPRVVTRDAENVLYLDGRRLGTVRELQDRREQRRTSAGYSTHASRPSPVPPAADD